ncbi:MAG TPA: hypothetical protein VMV44_09710 [Rectinemataceae bacterium]|nr:hypothetical protein [Rectinemataceae bacterium]
MRRSTWIAGTLAAALLLPWPLAALPASPSIARELRLPVPGDPTASFRFLPDGEWRPFDRPLFLGASPGEERPYSIEVRDSSGIHRSDYLVDRLPPTPPKSDLEPGSYQGPLSIHLSAEAGVDILAAVSGPGVAFSGLAPWDPAKALVLPAVHSVSATWVIVAETVDAAGNESDLQRFSWTILPPDMAVSGRAVSTATPRNPLPDPSFDPGMPKIDSFDSSASLSFPLPGTGSLVAAVGSSSDLGRLERWQPLEKDGGSAILRLSGPYGWTSRLRVAIGLLKDGIISYRPATYDVALAPLEPRAGVTKAPPPPSIIPGPPGAAALLAFGAYDGSIAYSINGGPERNYSSPILVAAGEGGIDISWRGLGKGGAASPSASMHFEGPPLIPSRPIQGLDGASIRNEAFTLSPAPGATVRYELTEGDALPKEVGPSSRLLAEGLVLDTPKGTVRNLNIRYRAFSGPGSEAIAGDEGLLHLCVDKLPPPPPSLVGSLPSFSRSPLTLSLSMGGPADASASTGPKAGGGSLADDASNVGDRIMVLLDDGGAKPSTLSYSKAIQLGAPAGAAKSWTVMAWTLDEAGNASSRIGPFKCVIDPRGIYVDQGAAKGGTGDPTRPYASIEEAMAKSTGDRSIYVRSGYKAGGRLAFSGSSFTLTSGSTLRWLWPDSPDRGSIQLPPSALGSPSVLVDGGSLGLRGLSCSIRDGEGEAILVRNGDFSMEDSSLAATADKSLTLLSAVSSRLKLAGATLALGGTGGGADLVALDSRVSIEHSDLGSTGRPAWMTNLSVKGGELGILASRIGATAGIGFVGLSAESASLAIDRLLIEMPGSEGYRRGGLIKASWGRVENSYFVSTGAATTIFDLRDSRLAFIHDSFVTTSHDSSLMFSAKGGNPLLVDDLFIGGGASRLLETDKAPEAGSIGACAFAGFTSMVSGALSLVSPASLPPFDSATGRGRSFDLGKSPSIRPAPKGGYEVDPASPIVDAGISSGYAGDEHDFSGLPRPSSAGLGLPDIGADELR